MLLSERCFLASHGHGVCAACHVCSPIYHLQASPRATATLHQTRQTAPNVLVSFRQLHKATIPSYRETQNGKPAKATRAPRLIITLNNFSSSYSNKRIHLSGRYHHEQLERWCAVKKGDMIAVFIVTQSRHDLVACLFLKLQRWGSKIKRFQECCHIFMALKETVQEW